MGRASIFSQIPDMNNSFNLKDSLFSDDFRSINGESSFGFTFDLRGKQVPSDRQTIENVSKVLMTEGEDDSSTPKFIKTA